jgi:hypothetical protein
MIMQCFSAFALTVGSHSVKGWAMLLSQVSESRPEAPKFLSLGMWATRLRVTLQVKKAA